MASRTRRTLGRAFLAFFTITTLLCPLLQNNVFATDAAIAEASDDVAAVIAEAADLTACPELRIAIINGVGFHYEVLAGLLHVLRPYEARTDVYTHVYLDRQGNGIGEIFAEFKYNYMPFNLSEIAVLKPSYNVVILVSPEAELAAIAEMLHYTRPQLVICYVHNSDFSGVPRLIGITEGGGNNLQLVTLAPHASYYLANATSRPVDWVLAAFPFRPKENCLQAPEGQMVGACLKGFAIQGKLSSARRNYSAIWSQLSDRSTELSDKALSSTFRINILGKGDVKGLGIPSRVKPFINLLRDLDFDAFYETIHHNLALLPVFGSRQYFTTKFSSTVLTSLITGTPMVADDRFLGTYTMFNESSTYPQQPGEQEVDVLLRVLRATPAEVLAVRRAVLGVRREINVRAAKFYAAQLSKVCKEGEAAGLKTETAGEAARGGEATVRRALRG